MVTRRAQIIRMTHRWPQFVFNAYNHETKKLSDDLRSAGRWLNPVQRDQLADLIDRKIHFYGRGRKPGFAPNLTQLTTQFESPIVMIPQAGMPADECLQKQHDETKNKHAVRYQRTPEKLQRRIRISGWALAITKAHDRDTKDLSEYLRSADSLPLDHEQLEELADLIDRKIDIKFGKGRKPGRVTPLDEREGVVTTNVAVYAIKRRRRIFGKIPVASVADEIEMFAYFCSEAGYEVDIDREKAVASLRRGKPRRE